MLRDVRCIRVVLRNELVAVLLGYLRYISSLEFREFLKFREVLGVYLEFFLLKGLFARFDLRKYGVDLCLSGFVRRELRLYIGYLLIYVSQQLSNGSGVRYVRHCNFEFDELLLSHLNREGLIGFLLL